MWFSYKINLCAADSEKCVSLFGCMSLYVYPGARRFHESRSEVNIYDGDDGGLVMDIQHLRHRG